MDPVLRDILNDGIRKHVGKKQYSIYDENGSGNKGEYKRLQEEQKAIGWDNLLRGKYSKLWITLQKWYANKQKVKEQQEEQRQLDEDNIRKPSNPPKKRKK